MTGWLYFSKLVRVTVYIPNLYKDNLVCIFSFAQQMWPLLSNPRFAALKTSRMDSEQRFEFLMITETCMVHRLMPTEVRSALIFEGLSAANHCYT